jgi:CRP-like cAMP-binding protein
LLSDAHYEAIAPLLTPVMCEVKQPLGERGGPIAYIHFPCGSVISVVALMSNGKGVEVSAIGSEGFHGIDALVGASRWSDSAICQISGPALRMPVQAFHEAVAGDTPLRQVAMRYLRLYMAQVAQSVACNRLHSVEERFARWVLNTRDRVESDEFELKQEFMAEMLGVHRPQVSLVAGIFQRAGFVNYQRGHMSILDADGLERSCCECYQAGKENFDTLFNTIPEAA